MARLPFPASLGDVAAEWIEANCCHGPGDVYGEPVRITDEEHRFLEAVYALDRRTGRREVDLGAYVRRKGTRKSELGAWFACFEAEGPARAALDNGRAIATKVHDPRLICLATTEDQGDLVYGAFRAIVKASDRLAPLFDVGLNETHLLQRSGSVELKQAVNAAALDGDRPTWLCMDELHLWTARLIETFNVARNNLRKRRLSQPWGFAPTTPYGPGDESVLESLHNAVGGKGTGLHRVGRLLVDWRQAKPGAYDLSDPVQLREAIVEAGGDAHWSDTEGIASGYEDGTEPEHRFRRYWLGQVAEADAESWLPAGTWEAGRAPGAEIDPDGGPVHLGVDMAMKHDTAAVVAVQAQCDQVVAVARVFEPTEGMIDFGAVEQHLRDMHTEHPVETIAYDPAYFGRSAQDLLDEGLPMVEFPQSPARMVPACEDAYRRLCGGAIAHDFDAAASKQITSAVMFTAGEGWRLSKGRSKKKIDTAIALVMALAEEATPPPPPKPTVLDLVF